VCSPESVFLSSRLLRYVVPFIHRLRVSKPAAHMHRNPAARPSHLLVYIVILAVSITPLAFASNHNNLDSVVLPICHEQQSYPAENALHNLEMVVIGSQSRQKGAGDKYRAPRTALDVDNYPIAPPELELKQVHIYLRHGTFVCFCSW
jgi:hypothetical protein